MSGTWARRLAERAAELGPDVVRAAVGLLGGPTATASYLERVTGRPYRANLVCRWQRGAERLPEPAREALTMVVLAELLGEAAPDVARVLQAPQRL